MHRKHLALAGVLVLVFTAGCLGATVDEDALAEEQEYDWEIDTDAEIRIEESSLLTADEFTAVYRIDNQSSMELFRSGLSRDRAVSVRAVQFRYPNGTVVGADELTVETDGSRTTVGFPADNGTFAFTSEYQNQEVLLEPYVEGSYRAMLPPGHDVTDFLLADVAPAGFQRSTVDDRVVIEWEHVDTTLLLRYYATRDQLIFWGLVVGLAGIGLGGLVYFRREVNRLERFRREQGLDVDLDDDDRRRPPPGMN